MNDSFNNNNNSSIAATNALGSASNQLNAINLASPNGQLDPKAQKDSSLGPHHDKMSPMGANGLTVT